MIDWGKRVEFIMQTQIEFSLLGAISKFYKNNKGKEPLT